MRTAAIPLRQIIIDTLAAGERRELSIIVAIRNVSRTFKGDLASLAKSSLRQLVASGTIVECDGVYALSPLGSSRKRATSGDTLGSTPKNVASG